MLGTRAAGRFGAALLGVGLLIASGRAAAEVTVCVNVTTKTWSKDQGAAAPAKPAETKPPPVEQKPPPGAAPKKAVLPAREGIAWNVGEDEAAPSPAQPAAPPAAVEPRVTWQAGAEPRREAHDEFDAAAFLERMIEYEVTHEVGFAAVEKGCLERITVELYPLEDGWTVFARYSGNQREEKVDSVSVGELTVLAQRMTRALLRDVPVTETITRRSVLAADTEHRLRTIGVKGHVLFALGTALRYGTLPSANDDPAAPWRDERRFFTPASILLGYRGKFAEWGIDAYARGNLGITERTPNANESGGHVDYAGASSVGLHFLHYFDPDGITSLYAGGGASFELTFLTMIRPADRRQDGDRDLLVTGGLNVDLLLGYEFMRASAIHFFCQLELNVPTYGIHNERTWGVVQTYLPGAVAQIGIVF